MSYPMTTGRNYDEILRVIDSIQLTAKHKVATPAKYPDGYKTVKPYLRVVKQPS